MRVPSSSGLSAQGAATSGITINSVNATNADRTILYVSVNVSSDQQYIGWTNVTIKNKPGGVVTGLGTLANALRIKPAESATPRQIHTVAPEYKSGNGRWWNPENDGGLDLHFESDIPDTAATILLMQIAPPYSNYTRKTSINPGDNKLTLPAVSDFSGGLPNGLFKFLVIGSSGSQIAKGKIIVYRGVN